MPTSGFVLADLQIAIDQYRRLLAVHASLPEPRPPELRSDFATATERLATLRRIVSTTAEYREAIDRTLAAIAEDPASEHTPVFAWPSIEELAERTRIVIGDQTDEDATPPTIEDLARLHQLTWTARGNPRNSDNDLHYPLIVAQRAHIQRVIATQTAMSSTEKYRLFAKSTQRDAADIVLPPQLSDFADWRYGLDAFDLSGVELPQGVTVHSSYYDANTRYVVFAGKSVRVDLSTACGFKVASEHRWAADREVPTFADATRIALDTIAQWREAGLRLEHRRDGIYQAHTSHGEWTQLTSRSGDLRTAHELYRFAATHLGRDDLARRYGFDVGTVLSPASHADTSAAMRICLNEVAATLRERANAVDTEEFGLDPTGQATTEYPPSSYERADARALRELAALIVEGPPIAKPGDYIVTLRNAISTTGTLVTLHTDHDAAMKYARNQRPFNNTRVTVARVLGVHYDGLRTETVHTSPNYPPAHAAPPPRPAPRIALNSNRTGLRRLPPPHTGGRRPRL
ncbi:hypothetical protein [Nocardia noduli]|uniref:hypothetical protein n=1 Tax=Nocardia noduli TaxID=2815722 RepID=UPI001C23F168|nr:hypothetical protein [Nocardia noduli]